MKVALVYDRVNKWGGAERILLSLRELFPNAPLYTSLYDEKGAKWADSFKIKTSFLQKLPGAKSRNEFLGTFMPISFESFNFDGFDLVISVTSEAAKGIITRPETCHICYCLTPTRYLWSGYDIYFKNFFLKTVSGPFVSYLRSWDKVASQRPDFYFAISKEVKKRIKKYYKRESDVIYPPVSFKNSKTGGLGERKYFLLVSRLSKSTSYKRVDVAIDAFNENKLPLKIVGSGGAFNYYKNKSGENIELLGEVSDEALSDLYSNAIALIFPSNEDFGLVTVEAMAQGAPVIAFNKGGATEIVKPGISGEFFSEQNSDSLNGVLKTFDYRSYNEKTMREEARKFSSETFKQKFVEAITEKTEEYFTKL